MANENAIAAVEKLEGFIHTVRGQRVMLDAGLARVYGATTKRLNEQVKRSRDRFPADLAFQLNAAEWAALRSQFATSNAGSGGRRTLPWAFTEHGAIMLASVLNTRVAVRASVRVVRAFLWMREQLSTNALLAGKLAELERRMDGQDERIGELFATIRQLLEPPAMLEPSRREIGFHVREEARLKAAAAKTKK